MSGQLVEQGANVLCSHAGQASPTATAPRVRLGGQQAIALPTPWTVSGCPLPTNAGGPCVSAMWSAGTVRVRTLGQPLVVSTGTASCLPTGVPLRVVVAQTRVRAS